MADVDLEKIGTIAGLFVSLAALWRTMMHGSERAKQKADERTVELLRIHVFPKLDEIRKDVAETKQIVAETVPAIASEVVKQTIESSTKQVFEVAKELIKLKEWEGK